MIIAGIDPGFSGAITIMEIPEKIIECVDMPILKVGTKSELDVKSIKELLLDYEVDCIYIERSQVMPKQGIVSSGRYMKSYGVFLGLFVGLGIKYEEITPQAWKKRMMPGMQKEKQASIYKVNQLFPEISLPRKKDHGKADSILIALYGAS